MEFQEVFRPFLLLKAPRAAPSPECLSHPFLLPRNPPFPLNFSTLDLFLWAGTVCDGSQEARAKVSVSGVWVIMCVPFVQYDEEWLFPAPLKKKQQTCLL